MDDKTYVIGFNEDIPILAMLKFNGKTAVGGHRIKIQRLEQKLSVAEVFDHVERKVVTADKQTINSKGGG